MTAPPIPVPRRRGLQIYATDPMSGRRSSFRVVVDIPNEPDLGPGPSGELVEIVDFDGSQGCYYEAVSLNDPLLLMTNGLAPNDADPRFHQQMVYAVASKVIESARRALGRPITFRRSPKLPRLKLVPHAFYGANAFYDRSLNAVLFGYFQASAVQPGANLPGQMVFTCLSHDVIAHEVAHAIIHRLRPHFIEPTNPDVLAFHEAFSDLVALFQRYTYRDILREQIRTSSARLRSVELLTDLAPQFGYASGMREALRSAVRAAPDPTALTKAHGPHARGAVLMAAVFDGFFRTYERRVADLLRLSGGGEAQRSAMLDPDLVDRIANEVATLADYVVRMCFRAFDYLPPVDVTFGDFLRALVTADYEVNPKDPTELRFNIIEAFRVRGIYADVASLAEEALLLRLPDELDPPRLPEHVLPDLAQLFVTTASALDETARPEPAENRTRKRTPRGPTSLASYERQVGESFANEESFASDASVGMEPDEEDEVLWDDSIRKQFNDDKARQRNIAQALHEYARENFAVLGLADPNLSSAIAVRGFSPVYRIGVDQRLIVELVVQYVQTDRSQDWGGISPRAGTTVVFDARGFVRHIIAKPLPGASVDPLYAEMAAVRQKRTARHIEELDLRDPRMAWPDPEYENQRMQARADLRALHGGGH
jgi:hypothetical protein